MRPYEGVDGATSDKGYAWMIPESLKLHFSGYLKAPAAEEDPKIHSVVPTTMTCSTFTPQYSRSGKISSHPQVSETTGDSSWVPLEAQEDLR